MQYSTLEIDTQPTTAALRRRKGSNFYTFMSRGFYLSVGFFVLLSASNVACKTPKATETNKVLMEGTKATVVDYTGLDGCSKMLMLDDGQLLLPMNDENIIASLHYGQRVSITYKELDTMVSICMAENLSANIETIDLIEKVDFSWLDDIVKKSKPYNINRCSDSEGEFIYIQTGKMSTAYTIDGQEICNTPGKAMSDCVRRFGASKQCRIKGQ